jgi:hypothetical protein
VLIISVENEAGLSSGYTSLPVSLNDVLAFPAISAG